MDIQKIKLGNNTYDIKDVVSRTGFATATLVHNITDSNVQNGNLQFSGIVFYGDTAKTVELGKVKLNQLAIPVISSQYIATAGIQSEAYELENSTAGIIDSSSISIKLVDSKPVIAFNSTTDGTNTGTATEVQLPVGQSGTVALLSDITTSANNKVGYGNKYVVEGQSPGELDHTVLNFYKDQATQQANSANTLFQIHLDEISTESINTGELTTGLIQFNFGQDDSEYTRISPMTIQNKDYYVFSLGDFESNTVVKLPMDTSGTIALVSDVSAVQNQVNSINNALGLSGTDATATIDTYNEIKEFLEGLATSPDLASTLTTMQTDINSRLSASDIVDNLTSTATDKALSANQGKVLDGKITTLSNAAVKKISLNGEDVAGPTNGKVTLPDLVTKIQLNGKDQTLDTSGAGNVGKVNLNNIPTKIKFNGTDYTATPNSSTGEGLITINESDPVFTAHVAHSITQQDINNWNSGAAGVTDVKYATTGQGEATNHFLQQKKGSGNYVSFVQLPTARYLNTNDEPETLELVLASAATA